MSQTLLREKLDLAHQPLLRERLKGVRTFLAEYTFPNLYLFRQAHDYHLLRAGDDIYISGRTYDGKSYVMPTRDLGPGDVAGLLQIARGHDCVFPLPEEWLPLFKGQDVDIHWDEGDSDYVYTVDKISTFKGQKLHNKKNLRNQFIARYGADPQPLTAARMADARDILEAWQADTGESPGHTDYHACREALERYDELILCGGIYYAQGEPAGFIIGEEINARMFALHFAKAKRKFKGVYQYMFSHFAAILPHQYEYLNFEQDMGRQPLRIAKSQYHPDMVLKKYRVRPIN